jgi:hypothetical protein
MYARLVLAEFRKAFEIAHHAIGIDSWHSRCPWMCFDEPLNANQRMVRQDVQSSMMIVLPSTTAPCTLHARRRRIRLKEFIVGVLRPKSNQFVAHLQAFLPFVSYVTERAIHLDTELATLEY